LTIFYGRLIGIAGYMSYQLMLFVIQVFVKNLLILYGGILQT